MKASNAGTERPPLHPAGSASFTIEEVINAVIEPFSSPREYGTPGRPLGLRCKICGGEGVFGNKIHHDTACLLYPYPMDAVQTPSSPHDCRA